MDHPDISIIIPSYNGHQHLPPLLGSLRRLDYPRDRLEIILVDDCSTDQTEHIVREDFPEVRYLKNERNLHFAPTINRGAREAEGKWLLLLNNDMRTDPAVVLELLEAQQQISHCRLAAARILDWEGGRIIYNGGYVNIEGKGFEEQWPLGSPEADKFRPKQLFACGGAMLVDRTLFLELGGFDETYGIYYEDVDFGWRLHLAGYQGVFAPKAIVYHHLHAYMGGIEYSKKAANYERNSLWTLFKNLDQNSLGRLLPAALLLAAARSKILSEQSRKETEKQLSSVKKSILDAFESKMPERLEIVGRAGYSHLLGVNGFFEQPARLLAERQRVQALRKVGDQKLLASELFPDPFRIWAYNEDHFRYLKAGGYDMIWTDTIEMFDLKSLFAR